MLQTNSLTWVDPTRFHKSKIRWKGLYELKSKLLKGGYIWEAKGNITGVIEGDTRSLDYGFYGISIVV